MAHQREEQVLGPQVVVAEMACLLESRPDYDCGVAVAAIEHCLTSAPAAHVMLLVDRLAGDPKSFGDGLPRPPKAAGVVDVQLFELLHQLTQCSNGDEADGWVSAVYGVVQAYKVVHIRQLRLTRARCQPWMTPRRSSALRGAVQNEPRILLRGATALVSPTRAPSRRCPRHHSSGWRPRSRRR